VFQLIRQNLGDLEIAAIRNPHAHAAGAVPHTSAEQTSNSRAARLNAHPDAASGIFERFTRYTPSGLLAGRLVGS
jgi:hypothetical protein